MPTKTEITYRNIFMMSKQHFWHEGLSHSSKVLGIDAVVHALLPNFHFRDYADCSCQERIVFNAWINPEIVYGTTPQYIIKVNPRIVSINTTLQEFFLVIRILLE
jgi:hypothetical protein